MRLTGFLSLAVVLGFGCSTAESKPDSKAKPKPAAKAPTKERAMWNAPIKTLQGKDTKLENFKGKALLLVNVASKCGLTPQYTQLEDLQKKYADKGFTVVGFPCNQFGGQEPGTEKDIVTFCQTNYDVSFPMSAKLDVNGARRHALYSYLTSPDTGVSGDITWNFEKFLIARDGKVLKRYPPGTTPQDRGLMQDIADAL